MGRTRTWPPGTQVTCQMHKWDGRPHWVFRGLHLGADRHGDWIGYRAGTRFTRPGVDYRCPVDQVGLVPAAGADPDRGFLATFHAPGGPVDVYVDLTTPPEWEGRTVQAVDLDLDVVRGPSGRVWVDDEDEFARHRATLGYPDDLVARVLSDRDRILAAVIAREPPYDDTPATWLATLAALR